MHSLYYSSHPSPSSPPSPPSTPLSPLPPPLLWRPRPQILLHAAQPRIPFSLIVSSMPDFLQVNERKTSRQGGHGLVDLLIIKIYDSLLFDILQTPKKENAGMIDRIMYGYRHYQISEPRRERNAPGRRVETGQWKSLAEILVIPLTIADGYIMVAIEDPVAFDLCAVVGAPYWLFFRREAGPKLRTCKTYYRCSN